MIDEQDAADAGPLQERGLAVCVTRTLMRDGADKARLAAELLDFAGFGRGRAYAAKDPGRDTGEGLRPGQDASRPGTAARAPGGAGAAPLRAHPGVLPGSSAGAGQAGGDRFPGDCRAGPAIRRGRVAGTAGRGLSVAAQRAAEWSRRHGYEAQLLIPADIARLDESELRRLLDHRSRGPCVLICPASDAGTNALLTTPPDAIPFCFGERSSALHHAAALRRGLHCELLQMEHLRFDVDTPDDLDSLIQDNSGQGRRSG
ncbi:hypothetical protein [Marinobacterium aestuariivivens]|uniref:MobA-like NTP transferase domain-containing protein n=1 Tax=Marinobacterium aestuariivivens TaxID=1698799 RepID=A0ABW1ZXJ4_9GAMM